MGPSREFSDPLMKAPEDPLPKSDPVKAKDVFPPPSLEKPGGEDTPFDSEIDGTSFQTDDEAPVHGGSHVPEDTEGKPERSESSSESVTAQDRVDHA